MMMARWDNIEILQAIDRIQHERYSGGLAKVNGMQLMNEINGSQVVEDPRWRGFIREIDIARDMDLLTFKAYSHASPDLAEAQPHTYLQNISDFGLTVKGQDRAHGRLVVQPMPDPADDDGRPLSSLIFKQIATAINRQYEPDEVEAFLHEEGIPPAQLPLPTDIAQGDAYTILATLWRWESEGRRLTRRFIGRWLADLLPTGPDPELRVSIVDQLARQRWRIRQTDEMLVIDDPASGLPVSAFLRGSRMHALIEAEARPQFLIDKPEQAVFASMRAVEVRVRKLAGFGDETIGVDLINRAFGPGGPLTDPSSAKGEQEGTRALFAGAYAMLRNPSGHRQVHYGDVSEAGEAVQAASLLMRILDRVEDRLGASPV